MKESIEVSVRCALCTEKLINCTMGVKCEEDEITPVHVGKWHKTLNKRLFLVLSTLLKGFF